MADSLQSQKFIDAEKLRKASKSNDKQAFFSYVSDVSMKMQKRNQVYDLE